ncbi:UNKNOWN [Stylonychia lemnae]|uniref:Uncharacterized protein n=1 Tax=Stylonychia lemnae TaxID=5949 RepID=A0A078AZX4_STYLE|nr:UNKNOWN [Stylonychia lemnae]|eukprot:CDW87794.1 UNKNOWN [Stylonychia lemnae]
MERIEIQEVQHFKGFHINDKSYILNKNLFLTCAKGCGFLVSLKDFTIIRRLKEIKRQNVSGFHVKGNLLILFCGHKEQLIYEITENDIFYLRSLYINSYYLRSFDTFKQIGDPLTLADPSDPYTSIHQLKVGVDDDQNHIAIHDTYQMDSKYFQFQLIPLNKKYLYLDFKLDPLTQQMKYFLCRVKFHKKNMKVTYKVIRKIDQDFYILNAKIQSRKILIGQTKQKSNITAGGLVMIDLEKQRVIQQTFQLSITGSDNCFTRPINQYLQFGSFQEQIFITNLKNMEVHQGQMKFDGHLIQLLSDKGYVYLDKKSIKYRQGDSTFNLAFEILQYRYSNQKISKFSFEIDC